MTEEQFRAGLVESGYGNVTTKRYEPNADGEFHTHAFSARLMVTEGELTLVREHGSETFGPGQWCEVPAGTVHFERSGAAGASVLAGTT
jgi:quercetin dioxygenase-like cupin family protein